ncbi:MAG: bifunctional cytidylyltransferase/SDR family oxidoreductase [Micropruina sp.]|uniref:D-ribitol-5-phosphate cytidylyltransferase n=1 Tax=Micropruina sp. TaxID=2737536 RepID=UPI0039E49A29
MATRVGIILAGGTGSRVGLSIPKQLIKIAGKTVMEHTIEIFQNSDAIDEIFVLMHPDHIAVAEQIASNYPKVTKVIAGGESRNETTQRALAALQEYPADTKLMTHDAVRPLLADRIIRDCIDALDNYDAVDVAIASADTIIEVDDDRVITEIPPRHRMRRGQTPQAFRLGTLVDAYRRAWEDPAFVATDDCTVVLRYRPDKPIYVVEGSDHNVKITEPIDIFIADKLFQIGSSAAPAPTEPGAYHTALAGKVVVVLGGSYGIGADIAELATGFGATAHCYSRSGTGTHIDRAEDVEAAFADAFEKSGRIDYIVVTAGVLSRGKLADVPMDEIIDGIRVNYVGPVLAARCGLKYLQESQGQLLFFTSSSYTRGRASYSVYSSCKAAVVNLTQALADEWSDIGVRVNCINPERTATPMRSKAFGAEPEGSLLSSKAVALTSMDVLLSNLTGHVVDVRRMDSEGGLSRTELEARRISEALAKAESGEGFDSEI